MYNRRDSDIKIDNRSNILNGKRFDDIHITSFKKLLIKIDKSDGKIYFEDWNTLFMYINTYKISIYPKHFIDYYQRFKLKINKAYFGNTKYYFKFKEEEFINNDKNLLERINFFNQSSVDNILSLFLIEEIKQSNNQEVNLGISFNDEIYSFLEWRRQFESINYSFSTYNNKLIDFYKRNSYIIDLYYFNDSNNLFCYSYDVNIEFKEDYPKKFKDFISKK